VASRPCVIGIDDWAKRKGHTYGTIVVDLDRRCPVDLLEDRSAETIAAWLQAHPEVTVVARDRAEAYASGVTQGAPDAVQVADRWHLLKNLRDAVEAELRERSTLQWPRAISPPLNVKSDTRLIITMSRGFYREVLCRVPRYKKGGR
jgi:transposase